jgi:hypothetical protein
VKQLTPSKQFSENCCEARRVRPRTPPPLYSAPAIADASAGFANHLERVVALCAGPLAHSLLTLWSAVRRCPPGWLVVLLVLAAGRAGAHDVAGEIVGQSFIKPKGAHLQVIVRLPLVMLQGFGLPQRASGAIDLTRIEDQLDQAAEAVVREMRFLEDGRQLIPEQITTRISQPAEQGFESFEQALATVTAPPLPDSAEVFWNQGFFDLHLAYPIRSETAAFSLDFGMAAAGLLRMVARFVPPDGSIRAYEVHGGHGLLDLDPGWRRAAWTFVKLGFAHILDGIDHILFLLCLVLPFRLQHLWSLVAVVTAFTIAHSITLIAAATGLVPAGAWFPPVVEALIAASIVYMALENVVGVWIGGDLARRLRFRWLIAGLFGLVHGFGFSFALAQELQFAGGHLVLSLLAFNLGIELGQLLILLVALPALTWLLRGPQAQKIGIVIGSALLAHTGWHWMLERLEELRYVTWPTLEVDWAVLVLAGLSVLALLAGLAWLQRGLLQRRYGDD